ncbi:VWA domain-containing protein [Spongiibacter sp. KMU-158]|uniref:VWA domain-containing protein n=1 Tax=Spongiibacter pelagi TaxID=2760804 RepID=A0A927BY30_9GAMM|nr:VWA domain-containing protein [Spongiibacter pelagi]MBD2857668.1 VWA domain-containing protein [Spongiibacter pelagi]
MQETLLQFIRHLRHAGVTISTAETLDAMSVAAQLGYRDKTLLYHGLAACLAKTDEQRQQYHSCFKQFFEFDLKPDVANESEETAENESSESEANDAMSGQGSMGGGGGSGQGNQGQSGQNQSGQDQEQSRSPKSEAQNFDQLRADVIRAAAQAQLEQLRFPTQRGIFRRRILEALNDPQRQSEIQALGNGDAQQQERSRWLQQQRDIQLEMVREMIDRQLLLTNNAEARATQEALMRDSSLSAMDQYYRKKLPPLIRKLAKKLASRHKQRLHRAKRGKPDLGKTLRRNIAYGGVPFNRYWRQKKREKSEIYVLCDLSGSVSAWSEVLMLFVQALAEVLPNTRSFVFCGRSHEVSEEFKSFPAEQALALIRHKHGMGSSDYGLALNSFRDQIIDKVNRRSCIIILGDGRGNGGDTGIDALRELYQRARLLLWFNPEPQSNWNTGDSEIRRYQSASHYVAECGSLRKLEYLLDDLLTLMR